MMLIFAAAMALLAPAEQWLVWPIPDGFAVGDRQDASNGSIEEQIPKGETLADWSRMVTTITIPGDQAADAFSANLAAGWKNACPGGTARSLGELGDAGSANSRMDCPLNPATGKPETMFMRSFQGDHMLVVLQVAFRHMPSSDEAAWARAHLSAAVLCLTGTPKPACTR